MPLNKDARECSFFQEKFMLINRENPKVQKLFRRTSIKGLRD